MLHLVSETTTPSAFTGGRDAAQRRSISIVPSVLVTTGADMMAEVLNEPTTDAALDSLYHASEAVKQFCDKTANYLTLYFPATELHFKSALHEVLDAATLSYLRVSSGRDPSDQIAHFMSTGVRAAASALLGYRVSQTQNRSMVLWEPWEHGPLGQWAEWGGCELLFTASPSPTADARYAARVMLMQRLLRFQDVKTIARSGIDMSSLDLF